jgi:hypothetical protein
MAGEVYYTMKIRGEGNLRMFISIAYQTRLGIEEEEWKYEPHLCDEYLWECMILGICLYTFICIQT